MRLDELIRDSDLLHSLLKAFPTVGVKEIVCHKLKCLFIVPDDIKYSPTLNILQIVAILLAHTKHIVLFYFQVAQQLLPLEDSVLKLQLLDAVIDDRSNLFTILVGRSFNLVNPLPPRPLCLH